VRPAPLTQRNKAVCLLLLLQDQSNGNEATIKIVGFCPSNEKKDTVDRDLLPHISFLILIVKSLRFFALMLNSLDGTYCSRMTKKGKV